MPAMYCGDDGVLVDNFGVILESSKRRWGRLARAENGRRRRKRVVRGVRGTYMVSCGNG